jgi:hypothetical protein
MEKSENTWPSLGRNSTHGAKFKEKAVIYLYIFFTGD